MIHVYCLFDYVCYTTFIMKNNWKFELAYWAGEIVKKVIAIAIAIAIVIYLIGLVSILAVGEGRALPEWMVFTFYYTVYATIGLVCVACTVATFGVLYLLFRVLEYQANRTAQRMLPQYRRKWRRYEFTFMVIANCIGLLFTAVGKIFKCIGACFEALEWWGNLVRFIRTFLLFWISWTSTCLPCLSDLFYLYSINLLSPCTNYHYIIINCRWAFYISTTCI